MKIRKRLSDGQRQPFKPREAIIIVSDDPSNWHHSPGGTFIVYNIYGKMLYNQGVLVDGYRARWLDERHKAVIFINGRETPQELTMIY
jgi:hypothetical protein